MTPKPRNGLPADELARLVGCAESTLKLHIKAGAPMPRSRKDVQAWLPRYHQWRNQQRRTSGPAPAPRSTSAALDEQRRWQTALVKLQFGREAGKLVDRREVLELAAKAARAVTLNLGQFARRFAARWGPRLGPQGYPELLQDLLAETGRICAVFREGMTFTELGLAQAEAALAAESENTAPLLGANGDVQ